MVGALNPRAEISFSGGAHARAAVAADVVESLHGVFRIAHNDEAFAPDFPQEIIAWSRNDVCPTGANPRPEVEFLEVQAEQLRICVIAGGKRLKTGVSLLHQRRRVQSTSSPNRLQSSPTCDWLNGIK